MFSADFNKKFLAIYFLPFSTLLSILYSIQNIVVTPRTEIVILCLAIYSNRVLDYPVIVQSTLLVLGPLYLEVFHSTPCNHL